MKDNLKHDNPFRQFQSWFSDATRAGIPGPNAMILSTSSRDLRVSARVVLLKEWNENGFVFFSNYDSLKGRQISENKKAALTFFWPALKRQIRVEGTINKTSRLISVQYFNSRPIESRISACISPQSCPVPDREFLQAMRAEFKMDLGDSEPVCPKNWGGFRLSPVLMEFWQEGENRLHDRISYRYVGRRWVTEILAP